MLEVEYNYFGKVFDLLTFSTVQPGYEDGDRLALAISESNEANNVEILFMTAKETQCNERIIPICKQDYEDEELQKKFFLQINTSYTVSSAVIGKYSCKMSESFMEKVLRELHHNETRRFYKHLHIPKLKKPFIPGKSKIPYAGRVYDEKEMIALMDSALDFWLTTGRFVDKFEKDFADFLDVKNCILANSGSSANLLAFMALTSPNLGDKRINRGDEIITVAAGFPTTIAPIIQYGAVPVFVDVTLPTYNIDCSQLEDALSDKTKSIMIAHTLGNPFDLNTIRDFCNKHSLWLIEDNCDALGSQYFYNGKWMYTGTIGHLGTSSFYPPHHITMGEGGAVLTNDTNLKRIVESFRDWGRDCWCPSGNDNTCQNRFNQKLGELPLGYDHKYIYSHFGYNLKVTEMQAAIGCAQLKKLPFFIETRKHNWKYLYDGLAGLAEYFILPEATGNSDPSWFGFPLTVKENAKFTRDEMVNYLESNGIQTRMLFAGNIVKHPCFDNLRENGKAYRIIGKLNNTERIMNNTFWIGVYPGLTEKMLEFIVNTINKFIGK